MLWKEFREEPFTFEQAKGLFKEENPSFIIVMLHELRKSGWLESRDDTKDSRKSIYTLKHPEYSVTSIEV